MTGVPYNPLDKGNLADSVARAVLENPAEGLSVKNTRACHGEGVYLLYYHGSHPAYETLSAVNKGGSLVPIYVGKAMLSGSRKGVGVGVSAQAEFPLRKRLREHAKSIDCAENLCLDDFTFRFLSVDNTFIILGEAGLINRFVPLWNVVVDGFGNHAPGGGRDKTVRSRWDTLHPGRGWARGLRDRGESVDAIVQDAQEYLRARVSLTDF